MKSLIYGIIDEKDAKKWRSLILENRKKSDFMVLGSVSQLGNTLNEFKEHGIDVFNIANHFDDFCIHRNSILDIIKNDPKYSDCDFFLSIDSDEQVVGDLPEYLKFTDISVSAIWAYYYNDILRDSIYVGHRAFSGRNFPTWGGVVHDSFIECPDDQIFSNKFKLVHHRENLHRNKSYLEIINEKYSDLFETRLAFIHEAYTTHSKIEQDFVLLDKAYKEMHDIVIPSRVRGYIFGHQNSRFLLYKFRIALALGLADEAKMYAIQLYQKYGQRLGIFLEWFVEKTDTELFIMKYLKADPEKLQFIDMTRPWWK